MARLTILLLVAAGLLPAQPKIEVEEYQLPNGMHVILHPDHTAPLVHLNLRFRVGSKHEGPGRSGFAHLFEHLMYEGPNGKGVYEDEASALGATGTNAHTYADCTDYHETVPASRLERFLWLESRLLATLEERVTQASFEKEREIVINERREKIDNKPYNNANSLLHRYVFPPGHPYAHDVIGSPEDLTAARLEDVRAFYKTFYTPDNASLVVSGDFDAVLTKGWIAKYFGWMTPGGGLVSPPASAAPMAAPKIVEVTANVPYARFVFAWAGPAATDPDATALEFARFILNERWRPQPFRDSIGFDPGAANYQLEDASVFVADATAEAKVPGERVRRTIIQEIERFAREGPSKEEMEKARANLEMEQLGGLEELSGISFLLNQVQLYYGDAKRVNEWLGRYSKVTPDAIREAVSRWALTPNTLTIHYTPVTAHRGETPAPDFKTPPRFQGEKPFEAPQIRSAKLPNGLQVFVVERHALPKVSVELRLAIGAAHAPSGKAALPLVAMLTTGCATPSRGEEELISEITRLAVSMGSHADESSQYASFETLRRNFEPAMALMSDLLLHPVYPKDVFERRKSDAIEQFTRNEGSLDQSGWALHTVLFGAAHPLGGEMSKPENLRAITIADVEEFRRRFWRPDAAALIFAGDITFDDALAAATRYFGEWKGEAERAGALPPPQPMKGRVFLLERSGVTQTRVVMAQPGIARDNPDYPALLLVNTVLSEGTFSRLYRSLRLDLGITYGVNSGVAPFPGYGIWAVDSPVEAARTRDAMAAMLKEVRGLAGGKPITPGELDQAKEQVIRDWPLAFQSNESSVERIGDTWLFDRSLATIRNFPATISGVTLDQVNAAARKYARPEQAVFLLVGDPEKIGTVDGLVTIK
jgi:zinc protease